MLAQAAGLLLLHLHAIEKNVMRYASGLLPVMGQGAARCCRMLHHMGGLRNSVHGPVEHTHEEFAEVNKPPIAITSKHAECTLCQQSWKLSRAVRRWTKREPPKQAHAMFHACINTINTQC